MISQVQVRFLRNQDIPIIVSAFSQIGWDKPAALFEKYLQEAEEARRLIWVAFIKHRHGERSATIQRITGSPRHFVARDDELEFAGYVTLKWQSLYPPFNDQNIPEIMDLNVLPPFRKIGVGSMLLETAEKEAVTKSSTVGIGVGLYAGKDGGYGVAQRLYVKCGYTPDGMGVTYNYQPIIPGNSYPLDDDLVLWFTKKLR
jgi:GNAT superfamily N-acetyltransferase